MMPFSRAMLEIRNKTPFVAAIVPGLDKHGSENVTVVVKGTYRLQGRGPLKVAPEQEPIHHADVFHGEPGQSSIRYEADACPAKKGTDVVLVGHAVAPRAVPHVDVSLSVGPVHRVVRVLGDRAWYKLLGRAAISDPIPFTRMPIVYERAFGGPDLSVQDPASRPRDPRNPVGVGWTSALSPDDVAGVRLPNIEDPERLIQRPEDRPPIAGFGFIGRDWLPRRTFAGTYDAAWSEERMPLLPADFDDRYHSGAAPGLATPRPLVGGERAVLQNVSDTGDVTFDVPDVALQISLLVKRRETTVTPALDTLLIEPDERRVVLTHRVTVPCPRELLYLDRVTVRERRPA